MSKHIGIIGCSAEGAALCYRTICREHDHPVVSMHTHPLAEYMRRIERDDWAAVGELMLSSAESLARGGADVLICPDNTIHRAVPYITDRLPRPFLHIAEVVAAEAARRGFRKPGLTGTRYLVESNVYPASYVRPSEEEREEINRIIFAELVNGIFTDASRSFVQRVIAALRTAGCDAVVLGCTELPLLITDETSPLPTLDSTRLLAGAAVGWANHLE
jgi:aspartate racemase